MHCLIGSLEGSPAVASSASESDEDLLLVDPAVIQLHPDPQGDACVMGREFLGQAWQYRVQQGPCDLRVNAHLSLDVPRGTRCRLAFQPGAEVILFPQGIRLRATDPSPAAGVPAPQPIPPA